MGTRVRESPSKDDKLRGVEVGQWLCRLPPEAASSILTDRLAGRELEWEARNGVIGRLGRRDGVPTPVSDTVAALLHAAGGPAGRPA